MEIKDLIDYKVAFHCDTEEKAKELLKKADELGYRWSTRERFIDTKNYWETYCEDTCYSISQGQYTYLDSCKERNYKIIEYKLDSETNKNTKIKNGDRVIYRNKSDDSIAPSWTANKDITIKELEENNYVKVLKVERPFYKEIYQVRDDILDEEEKEYLRNVIKPFRNRIDGITKFESSQDYNKAYIKIEFENDEDSFALPYFNRRNKYKNMNFYEPYSLEELGL